MVTTHLDAQSYATEIIDAKQELEVGYSSNVAVCCFVLVAGSVLASYGGLV